MRDQVALPQPRRGDIWLVAFGAARKGEIGKTRPAVVVSSDDLISGSPHDLVTVVPLSASLCGTKSPFILSIPADHGLEHPSVALCHSPRAFVPSRFLKWLGRLPDALLDEIIAARAIIEGWPTAT